ncbi:MAG: hypothetical protein O7F73_09275 [Gammaproteobacteria bacterium]|nr:hypothetical protein [Gammaproteobacteria bacterium]
MEDGRVHAFAGLLKEHRSSDVFPHVAPASPERRLPAIDHSQTEQFLTAFDSLRVLPWIGGVILPVLNTLLDGGADIAGCGLAASRLCWMEDPRAARRSCVNPIMCSWPGNKTLGAIPIWLIRRITP